MVRLLEGRLKIGLALNTVLISLANVFSTMELMRLNLLSIEQPDIGRLAECILEGIEGLSTNCYTWNSL